MFLIYFATTPRQWGSDYVDASRNERGLTRFPLTAAATPGSEHTPPLTLAQLCIDADDGVLAFSHFFARGKRAERAARLD